MPLAFHLFTLAFTRTFHAFTRTFPLAFQPAPLSARALTPSLARAHSPDLRAKSLGLRMIALRLYRPSPLLVSRPHIPSQPVPRRARSAARVRVCLPVMAPLAAADLSLAAKHPEPSAQPGEVFAHQGHARQAPHTASLGTCSQRPRLLEDTREKCRGEKCRARVSACSMRSEWS